ncbi:MULTISPECIES: GntR family transcriptional regulator [Streptomyces]|uniref:GntR family transcriptional regulator n=1 Tax=Streptomyces evansiae TaxID=3075535 RepID=A0ABU2RBL8_9ACTN|nr:MULTISPECIES: GntR family transcriptional regulator [unclassified Streptomyces]MDT0412724.1 GntR family transcriptional regulator [Streptomyces sp. DSM 41979]MYQ56418.1 GntR family transcriptional regulator [Streptomyces sp. SID4926]SCE48117.1 DNA-binding transcriptional regulator, GntR family [Streptomyces sp. DfronAA-171]
MTTGTVAAMVEDLRHRIEDGRLEAGAQLPATSELVQTYGLSSNAVWRGIALLKASGHLTGRQGKGVYVTTPAGSPSEIPAPRPAPTASPGDDRDGGEEALLLEAGAGLVEGQVARLLGVAPGTPVHTRRYLISRGGAPYALRALAYPPFVLAAVPEAASTASLSGELRRLIGERLGSEPADAVVELSSRHPTGLEKHLLELHEPDAVVSHRVRTLLLADERPLLAETTITSGTHALRRTLPAAQAGEAE